MKSKILVITAHPDDEVLGCGGTIYRLTKDKEVFIVFAANGVSGRKNFTPEEMDGRKESALKVSKQLGANLLVEESYGFQDQRLDQEDFNNIVNWIESLLKKVKPDIVFTHFAGDLNRDHQIIAEATIVACRPFSHRLKEIYAFELPESTENGQLVKALHFKPNVYFDINLKAKLKIFNCYQTEKRRSDKWEKGIVALARYRGFNAGLEFAEAFLLVRKIND